MALSFQFLLLVPCMFQANLVYFPGQDNVAAVHVGGRSAWLGLSELVAFPHISMVAIGRGCVSLTAVVLASHQYLERMYRTSRVHNSFH